MLSLSWHHVPCGQTGVVHGQGGWLSPPGAIPCSQHEWHWLDHVLLVSHRDDQLGLGLAGEWVSGETNIVLHSIIIEGKSGHSSIEHLVLIKTWMLNM